MKKTLFLFLLSFQLTTVSSQNCEIFYKDDQTADIKKSVSFLADDRLEGRAPGTEGEQIAATFIAEHFSKAGLKPAAGNGTYFQTFMVPEPVEFKSSETFLIVGKDSVALRKEFYPLLYSANKKIIGATVFVGFGITAPELKYDDYAKITDLKDKIAVIDVSSPDGIHPHSAYAKYHDLGNRAAMAAEKGAIGVIFVNLGTEAQNPQMNFKSIRASSIPVVFVADEKTAKRLRRSTLVHLGVGMNEVFVEARNVVGYLHNNKNTTIAIGAHYDHLGWGHQGSLHTGERAIHNGADDNASGTAALIALADYISSHPKFAHHNYLFIAFTAEERGLLGSNYYVNNPSLSLETMAYMINMDMIGRLREGNLQVSGTGTSTEWQELFKNMNCQEISFKLDPSGIGPSDHTPFYNNGVPVLHFFTGSHEDYHKPTDDIDKVNYEGINRVVNILKYVISTTADKEMLTYQQTKSEESTSTPRFSVTLGIMPDYMYDKGGVRVDGVSQGKPAANAGLKKGDILMKLGDFNITDMQAYMTALSAYKKGDKTTLVYERDGKKQEAKIQF